MSYNSPLNPQPIVPADGGHLDAFSRQRTSQATPIFDAQHHYGEMHHLFTPVLTTGGTITDSPVNSSLTLAVTATVGSKVVNRSRRHYYVAGQSHLIAMTFSFGTTLAGIRKRVGYYDNDDGFFLQNLAGAVSLVLRTSTSGAPVDTVIAQASWNIDKMDGTGVSGITVDWTKTHIFEMDMQWLGVGRVRFYLNINGIPYLIHEILNANVLSQVYMQTPHLPCTYEIENLASVGVDSLMQICSAVFTEGAPALPQVIRSTSTDFTAVTCTVGSSTHVLSIRPAALFKGRANKGMVIPLSISLDVTGANSAHFEIIEDATLTASVFTAHPSTLDSMVEISKGTASTYTAASGRGRTEGYVTGGAGAGSSSAYFTNYQLQIDGAGVPDILTIVAGGIGGSATVLATITWAEYY